MQDARIYTLPEQPVPIYVSGFGPQAIELAARIGDGFCTTPGRRGRARYRDAGGGSRPVQGGIKVCFAETEDAALDTAHRRWANDLLPGQLAQVLPRPRDFEAAASLVQRDAVGAQIACGPDPQRHIDAAQKYVDAGFDEVYVQQIGGRHDGFFQLWADKVLPGTGDAGTRQIVTTRVSRWAQRVRPDHGNTLAGPGPWPGGRSRRNDGIERRDTARHGSSRRAGE